MEVLTKVSFSEVLNPSVSLSSFHTRLVLTRHGETNSNKNKTFQGEQPSYLNETGRGQAQDLAVKLESEKIDLIGCSIMDRAKQTAEIVATHLQHKTVYVFANLREFKIGKLEGKPSTDYKDLLKKSIENGEYTTLEQKRAYRVIEGANTIQEVLDRVIPTLKYVAMCCPNQKVALVIHAWVMQVLVSMFKEVDKDDVEVKNTGMLYVTADYNDGETTLTLEGMEGINIEKGRLFKV